MTDKPRGPATYYPAIEAKYGRSIDEWKTLIRTTGLSGHKAVVDWLKAEHGMGHGHAGALAHGALSDGTPRPPEADLIAGLFTAKKAHWRPVYDRLAATIEGLGDVQTFPKKGMVGFAAAGAKGQFVVLSPSTADRFDIGLKLKGIAPTERLGDAAGWYTSMTHRLQLTSPDQLDDEVLGWVADAYKASL